MRSPSQAVGKVEIVVRREELDFFFYKCFFPLEAAASLSDRPLQTSLLLAKAPLVLSPNSP